MNVTAEYADGAVVLELDEGCRSVAALRKIICAALPHLNEDGFAVTVQEGSPAEDADVCGLEEGATIRVVASRRAEARAALRAEGRSLSEEGLKQGVREAMESHNVALCERYLDAADFPRTEALLPFLTGNVIFPSVEMCELLLVRGFDVHGRTWYGSPLHEAASRGLPEICALLLRYGAAVNARSGNRRATPLRCCLGESAKEHKTREVLLSHGADMRAQDDAGQSPLSLARRRIRRCERVPSFNAMHLFVTYGAPPLRVRRAQTPRAYSRYIHKLAKVQFKTRRQQVTWEGMGVVNAFVTDVLERLGGEAGRVTSFSGAKTLSVRSVVAAVKLQLPEELATHALAAGTAAVGRYAKACGR